jgi:hypothetical protein
MITAFIPIIGSIFDFLINNVINLAGGVGAVFMALLAWLVKKYLIPFLDIERHRRYAGYIATIADEITDDLVRKYPDKRWLQFIDEAVDRVIEICDIQPEIARRAVSAALARK